VAALAIVAGISLVAPGVAAAKRAPYDGRIVRIDAPSGERLVTSGAVTLRFHAQSGTHRVRVFLDHRNVTRRV
jgi:hypothetical protein